MLSYHVKEKTDRLSVSRHVRAFLLHFLRKRKVRCFTKDLTNHIMSYHAVQDSNFFFWYKVQQYSHVYNAAFS